MFDDDDVTGLVPCVHCGHRINADEFCDECVSRIEDKRLKRLVRDFIRGEVLAVDEMLEVSHLFPEVPCA